MKKFLLIASIFLISFNTNAKTPTKDVDTFYSQCKEAKDKENFQISAYCLGYTRGVADELITYRDNIFQDISPKCNPKTREILERFYILYQRNQFEIGSPVHYALNNTLYSLCPYITKEEYKKERGNLKISQ